MTDLIDTVLLFGGRSAEHEVSILSARSVTAAAPERIVVTPICIARDGRFVGPKRSARILAGGESSAQGDDDFSFEAWSRATRPDVVFPVIHGTNGEDGTLQGYLEILGLPYVGSGVMASAAGMDKGQMKYAFIAAKLPIVDHVQIQERDWLHERASILRAVNNALRLPYFVKPANGGSSVGVTKVKGEGDLAAAIETALRFDEKVLVERGIDAREIEVSVLGNDKPETSVPSTTTTTSTSTTRRSWSSPPNCRRRRSRRSAVWPWPPSRPSARQASPASTSSSSAAPAGSS